VHHLDRDFPVVPDVVGEVDRRHAAGAQLALQRAFIDGDLEQACLQHDLHEEGPICVVRPIPHWPRTTGFADHPLDDQRAPASLLLLGEEQRLVVAGHLLRELSRTQYQSLALN
jgi:hypothetical protein